MYNIRSYVIRWQIHDFLSDGNSNVCPISHHTLSLSLSLSLSLVISFLRASKATFSLFPTLHNFSALPSFPVPFPIGQF